MCLAHSNNKKEAKSSSLAVTHSRRANFQLFSFLLCAVVVFVGSAVDVVLRIAHVTPEENEILYLSCHLNWLRVRFV